MTVPIFNSDQLEMLYLNTTKQLFHFVDQLEVCLPYSRLLILAVFQKRWNSNKTSVVSQKNEKLTQHNFLIIFTLKWTVTATLLMKTHIKMAEIVINGFLPYL